MARAGFWDNPNRAQSTVAQLSALKLVIEPVEELYREVKDLEELFELAAAESEEDELAQLEDDLAQVVKRCEEIELAGLLCGPNDSKNCFFSIHAGAGGQRAATGRICCLGCTADTSREKNIKCESLILRRGKRSAFAR